MTNENLDLLIIILIGIAMIVFGSYKLNEYKDLIKLGTRAEGVVFDIENEYFQRDGNTTYYPIIRFTTKENEWVTERYGIGSSPSSYEIGESVNIIYDSSDSKKFVIDDTRTKSLGPVLMILGLVFILGVIGQYFLHPFQIH